MVDDGVGARPVIGVVGGTGPAGSAVAARFAAVGHEVVIGSREASKAVDVVAGVRERWPDRELSITGASNDEAVGADVVVLAAPWQAVLSLCESHEADLADRTVISMANALSRVGGNFLPITMPRGSVTAEVQALLPRARVVGAFHHLPSKPLADLDRELGCEVLICGNDRAARDEVVVLVDGVPGLHAIDAGSLASAGAIEAMTAVLVQINVNYRTHSMVRLIGDFSRR